ncbi:MAG: hypothetical protein IKC08_09375 [Lentisphaeria bacterium]|nr:hypothetical protein [Lentisphaeria bacterium]
MAEEKKIFENIEITHEFSHNGNLLEITPVLTVESPENTTLIASYFVDSFEMIESARFSIRKGMNKLPFMQKVKIFNPLIWHPCTFGEPALYELKTVFYKNGAAHYIILQMSGLRNTVLGKSEGKKVLEVNGKEIRCRKVSTSLNMPVKDLMKNCKETGENFVVISGSSPDADKDLEMCDRAGIVAALDVTGMTQKDHERIKHHPSICLHTAQTGEKSPFIKDFPFMTCPDIEKDLLQ